MRRLERELAAFFCDATFDDFFPAVSTHSGTESVFPFAFDLFERNEFFHVDYIIAKKLRS